MYIVYHLSTVVKLSTVEQKKKPKFATMDRRTERLKSMRARQK